MLGWCCKHPCTLQGWSFIVSATFLSSPNYCSSLLRLLPWIEYTFWTPMLGWCWTHLYWRSLLNLWSPLNWSTLLELPWITPSAASFSAHLLQWMQGQTWFCFPPLGVGRALSLQGAPPRWSSVLLRGLQDSGVPTVSRTPISTPDVLWIDDTEIGTFSYWQSYRG